MQSRVRNGLAAGAGLLALGLLASASAAAQIVRHEFVDRITDEKLVQLVLPVATPRGALIIRCGGMFLVDALPTTVKSATLTWRVDRDPPVDSIVQGAGPDAVDVEVGSAGPLRQALRIGQSLALRFGGPFGKADVEFVLGHDTRQSFVFAAHVSGTSEAAARLGYDHLEQTIVRAVAKQAPDFASLMEKIKVPLRDGTRTREAWELMPQILGSLRASRERPVVEDMGGVIFGYAWPQLKPLLKLDAAGYRALNGPAVQQLDWLQAACR